MAVAGRYSPVGHGRTRSAREWPHVLRSSFDWPRGRNPGGGGYVMSDQAPIPLGAQVVVREPGPSGPGPAERGAGGRVVQRRDGSYQVVLADGTRSVVRPEDRKSGVQV